MKKYRRILKSLTASVSALLLSFMPLNSIEISASDNNTPSETYSDDVTETESEIVHAYDPMAEIEEQQAEQELRDSVDYVKRTVLFSVIYQDADSIGYLDDSSALCKKYRLKNLEIIYEKKAKNGTVKVFYKANVNTSDIWSLVDRMNEDEQIFYAEPDYIWTDSAVGGYTAVSYEEYSKSTHYPSMDIEGVWDTLSGHKVKSPGFGTIVAVIDTGVDYTHNDLRDSMWINEEEIPDNAIDDDGNGYVDDYYGYNFIANNGNPMDDMGHGTHVAGIIAMSPGNGGGVGLAYGTKIMALKAGQATGSFASSDIAKAVKYAYDNGADVINMSFGGAGKSFLVEDVLEDAFSECVLVASAGNDGLPTTDAPAYYPYKEDFYPAGYSYVIGVMASDNYGKLADFSNWDYKPGENCEYEMAAPGVGIYSTLPGNRYALWSGTSMSAPTVSAAAAILRSNYTNKSKYTSRFIMGQLVGATEKTAVYSDDWTIRKYPALNIKESLTKLPKPAVKMTGFYIFDDKSISDANNGDGIAQPGETIDIGFEVFNYWGAAKDVTVTLDTLSIAEIPNPYADIITSSVNIGSVGSFTTSNNGYTYTDGALTGVSMPLRIKIKDDVPNDAQINLNFTVTAKNDLDSSDLSTYSASDSRTITVQNGYAINGTIEEDMTLTADKYWIIQNNVLIPEGVTVTVEPGTQIQFWSADPKNPYAATQDVYIQVEGRFIAEGTEDKPIEMFLGKGYEDRGILIEGNSDFSYCIIINPYRHTTEFKGDHLFTAKNIDHCHFIQNYKSGLHSYSNYDWVYYGSLKADSISNTIFTNLLTGNNCWWWDNSIICTNEISECLFDNCSVTIVLDSSTYQFTNKIDKTVFLLNENAVSNTSKANLKVCDNDSSFENNAVLNNLNANIEDWMLISTELGKENFDFSYNYWGTSNSILVKRQVNDADNDVSLCNIVQEPFLTLEDDMSDIYPFVTEAYLTDSDGNRIDTVNGKQTVTLHVKFNRDMAQDVQPMVTYGGSEPYTDYFCKGDWAGSREWTSEFTIDPLIDMGKMYIRVKGAAAADDTWLVTGEDSARFFFNITKSNAQSMTLQGSGLAGRNELTWVQDDYDTLAGYNIYRSQNYDPDIEISAQGFTRLNSSLLSSDECSYTDEDVEPSTDYYYYFTVMDTDMNESAPSNVVKCTPTESEPPVITHTHVSKSEPNKSITINAEITDNIAVTGASLFYKRTDSDEWTKISMKNPTGNSSYRAAIPAYDTDTGYIDYYITATDGTNIGTCGTSEEPFRITVGNPMICVVDSYANLTGAIAYTFIINVPDSYVDEGAKAVLNGAEGKKEYTISAMQKDSDGNYVLTYGVSPADMNSDISLKITNSSGTALDLYDSKGNPCKDNTFSGSVYSYLYKLSNNNTAKAMLNYGAYAELILKGSTSIEHTVPSEVTANDLKDYKLKASGDVPSGLQIVGMTLVLNSNADVRLYFKLSDDLSSHTIKLDEKDTVIHSVGDMYYVEVKNIPANSFTESHKITIDEYDIEFCTLTYAYNVLSSGSSSEKLRNLAKAMYDYSNAFVK